MHISLDDFNKNRKSAVFKAFENSKEYEYLFDNAF